jgi:hypothetical protein
MGEETKTQGKRPRLSVGACLALGCGIGAAIGAALGAIPIGLALGAGVGVAVGAAMSGVPGKSGGG